MYKGSCSPVKDRSMIRVQRSPMNLIDPQVEKKNDPKYKTELCKGFLNNGFCPYGHKCRFAHGKQELSVKMIDESRYKQKECKSFREQGFCMYGPRCNFKHDERKLKDISMSYYSYFIKNLDQNLIEDDFFAEGQMKNSRRLHIFQNLAPVDQPVEDSKNGKKEILNVPCFLKQTIRLL
jgi:hypothetical protein